MKPTLEVLKLRAEIAALEVQLAEQRIEFTGLIWAVRQLILESPDLPIDYWQDWLAKTDKFFL